MVKVTGFRTLQNEEGNDFIALEVSGAVEAVKSQETGRMYFTARKAIVPCTFNEELCKSLINTEFSGSIKKVDVDPYSYKIEETGETITLSHRYEYVSEQDAILESHVVQDEVF